MAVSLSWRTVFAALAEPDLATERELVVRAQEGDRAALGQLLRQFGPEVYRAVLLPRLGNPMAAEQALADTYARVVEKIRHFEWRGVSFGAWLRMVALHVALDGLRARRREVLFVPEDLEREIEKAERDTVDDNPGERFIQEDERAAVRRKLDEALGRVNPRYAEAIRLRILEEVPRDEVARRLGVTPATFDVLLHRAIASLRKAMQPDAVPPKRRGPS